MLLRPLILAGFARHLPSGEIDRSDPMLPPEDSMQPSTMRWAWSALSCTPLCKAQSAAPYSLVKSRLSFAVRSGSVG